MVVLWHNRCSLGVLVPFDNTIVNIATALQIGDMGGRRREEQSGMRMILWSSLTELEPAGTSRKERERVKDKFMSSGLNRNDALA